MIRLRPSTERGRAHHGWLDSRHSFSFANYYDPAHMGFRGLRVLNEDRVAPGAGFPTHPHRDMEIVTYVLAGALEHRDSMGNGSIIRAGDVQRMSAGTGVTHSEYNHSPRDPVHFLQIWIQPRERGTEPGYAQAHFAAGATRAKAAGEKDGALTLVVSENGRDGSLDIGQDVNVSIARLRAGQARAVAIEKGRGLWVQAVSGDVTIDGQRLAAGDGAAIEDLESVQLQAVTDAEALLFDLA